MPAPTPPGSAQRHPERPSSLQAYLLENLGRLIVGGEVPPGEALPNEMQIASDYGVSKTVVREAIRALAAKGLVVARPRLGTRICPHEEWHLLDPDVLRWRLASGADTDFIRDLDELREMIEPAVARLAAQRADPAMVAELQAIVRRMSDETGSDDDFFAADVMFHASLIRATGNALVGGLHDVISTVLRLRHELGRHATANEQALPYHAAVADAVAAGDAVAAEASMRTLLQVSRVL